MRTRLFALTTLVPLVLLASCQSGPNTAYTPLEPERRDTSKADALNQQAAALMDDDPEKAETLLREALATDLYHGPAHNNLGVLFLKQGKLYEAAGEFEWASKLLPGHPDPRLNLSLTLESAGRYEQAADHARTAVQVNPGHIASMQQLTKLELRHPRIAGNASSVGFAGIQSSTIPGFAVDLADRRSLRTRLEEIALRGDTPEWRDWARLQLATLDSSRETHR